MAREGAQRRAVQSRRTGPAHLGRGLERPASCRAVDDLLAVGHGRLWDDFFPAANRQGSRLVQLHDRRRIGDPLSGWDDRALDLGLVERSNQRASVAFDRGFGHRRDWIGGRRGGWKLLLVARGDVSRSCGIVWRASNVLAASLNVPEWNGRRRRNCADQFDRKPWGLSWTLSRGLDQGFDEQLR